MATVNWTTYKTTMPSSTWKGQTYTPTTFNAKKSPYLNQTYQENYNYDVSGARANYENQLKNKPQEYVNKYSENINNALAKLESNQNQSFDINKSKLYDMYKTKAIISGTNAMQDTMGQAAANTGGFGNSYGQIVGQQAYNAKLDELQSQIPTLASQAEARRQADTDNLYRMLEMYNTQEQSDYAKHRDTVSDYQTETDRLLSVLQNYEQLDLDAFNADRSLNEQAFEFNENQRYNSWNNYENRRQSQINADNANSLAQWQQAWNNYVNLEGLNTSNKAAALDMLYKMIMAEKNGYTITGF